MNQGHSSRKNTKLCDLYLLYFSKKYELLEKNDSLSSLLKTKNIFIINYLSKKNDRILIDHDDLSFMMAKFMIEI